MRQSTEIAMIFGAKPGLMVTEFEEGVDQFHLVYVIDSVIRDSVYEEDSMAGFLFLKRDNKYKVYIAYQTYSNNRYTYDGLKVFLDEEKELDLAVEIITKENEYESIYGVKNINDRTLVAKLIKDIRECDGSLEDAFS